MLLIAHRVGVSLLARLCRKGKTYPLRAKTDCRLVFGEVEIVGGVHKDK